MNKQRWYNFRTQEHDTLSGLPGEDAIKDYMPQKEAAFRLYDLYRQVGKPSMEAFANVMSSVVGEPSPFPLDDETDETLTGRFKAWANRHYQDYLDSYEKRFGEGDRFRAQMKADEAAREERTRRQVVSYMKENGHG